MSQSQSNSAEPQASGTTTAVETAAERHMRRRSTQLPARDSPVHTCLPRLFSNYGARRSTDSQDGSRDGEDDEDEEESGDFLARATSYCRLMHAHTKGQLDRPGVATLPSYTRTMHAFALNQLNHMENTFGTTTRSESSSPHVGAKMTSMPRVTQELSRMTLEEEPAGPLNTPEVPQRTPINDLAVTVPVLMQAQRKRSVTEPVPREYMAPKAIDFAATATLVN